MGGRPHMGWPVGARGGKIASTAASSSETHLSDGNQVVIRCPSDAPVGHAEGEKKYEDDRAIRILRGRQPGGACRHESGTPPFSTSAFRYTTDLPVSIARAAAAVTRHAIESLARVSRSRSPAESSATWPRSVPLDYNSMRAARQQQHESSATTTA